MWVRGSTNIEISGCSYQSNSARHGLLMVLILRLKTAFTIITHV